MKSRIDDKNGIAITPDFETVLDKCKDNSLADLHRLELQIKERLQLSDMKLLRSIMVFS